MCQSMWCIHSLMTVTNALCFPLAFCGLEETLEYAQSKPTGPQCPALHFTNHVIRNKSFKLNFALNI